MQASALSDAAVKFTGKMSKPSTTHALHFTIITSQTRYSQSPANVAARRQPQQLNMATRKRSRSDTEDASRPSSAAEDSPTTSASNSDLAIANKRGRKSAPINKIIDVAELCEQVLSHLPLHDLLHAMQVCRTFKATIENSPRLQKNLFLVPDLPRPNLAISSSGTLLSGTRLE